MGHAIASPTLAYRWVSPHSPGRSAAIAIIQLLGDPDALFQTLAITPVPPGGVALRNLNNIDTAVVAHSPLGELFLTPHAGNAVRDGLTKWFAALGIAPSHRDQLHTGETSRTDPSQPHAPSTTETPASRSTTIEHAMLETLATAASPLAIDLLLDQPRQWGALGVHSLSDLDALPPAVLAAINARSTILNRLLLPPRVIALGPPNIGKSTLLNALARRTVSIVADLAGTTRDHVGVHLDLAGLVVQYIDTPGITDTPIDALDRDSQSLALEAARDADLLLLCADPTSNYIPLHTLPPPRTLPLPRHPQLIHRLCLRADLGTPPPATDTAVSTKTGQPLDPLVQTIRNLLIPPPNLLPSTHPTDHPTPPILWRFWN